MLVGACSQPVFRDKSKSPLGSYQEAKRMRSEVLQLGTTAWEYPLPRPFLVLQAMRERSLLLKMSAEKLSTT